MSTYPGLMEWLLHGERGLSSEAIAQQLTGGACSGNHPWDPDDFRRCELLLRQCPGMRRHLPKMRVVSQEWARLVDRWDEIVAAMEAEGCFDLRRWNAPRSYALIRDVLGHG